MTHNQQPQPVCCPPELRRQALLTLNEGLPPSLQAVLLEALQQEQTLGGNAFQGLYYLDSEAPLAAAVWLQVLPGRTGVLWPPSFSHPKAGILLDLAKQQAQERELQLVQMLIADDESVDEPLLAEKGIDRIATLEYLWVDPRTCDFAASQSDAPDDDLVFLPNADQHPERLAAVLERTYEGTQDCPALNGVRDLEEVIAGYRTQGTMMPEYWYLLQKDSEDAGVLILASHQGTEGKASNWELVYMGIVPEFRGQGFSQSLVAHAVRQAASQNNSRLVLAVDEMNKPALDVYRCLGFQTWQRRRVYACLENES